MIVITHSFILMILGRVVQEVVKVRHLQDPQLLSARFFLPRHEVEESI